MAATSMNSSTLVFDMDDVLVDVLESYRASIIATVEHFTGVQITNELIQRYKNAGGWNDDWQLSQRLVLDHGGREVPLAEVVAVFQRYFIGTNGNGLILRERWLPRDGLLEQLASRHALGIFTGRPRDEMEMTLARFVPQVQWATTISSGDVAHLKPAPDGLLAIARANPGAEITYIGDNVDDARSARAAGVRFIGIASATSVELRELFAKESAAAVINNINEIDEVL